VKWLKPQESSSNYITSSGKHHSKTGDWFLEGDQIPKKKGGVESFPWIHGIRTFCNPFSIVLVQSRKMQLEGHTMVCPSVSHEYQVDNEHLWLNHHERRRQE